MCRPRATGSRQAKATTCARWRGGNPLGASRTVRGSQQDLAGAPADQVVAALDGFDGAVLVRDAAVWVRSEDARHDQPPF